MGDYCIGKEQSLEDILRSRETRSIKQRQLLEAFGVPIVSFKLNIPGPIKSTPLYKDIFQEGLKEFDAIASKKVVEILWNKCYYEEVGPLFLAAVNYDVYKLKNLTSSIEEKHPLGRLFDFDVWKDKDHQISREELGLSKRRCLVCEEEAFICGRSRKHSLQELLANIEGRAKNYFNET